MPCLSLVCGDRLAIFVFSVQAGGAGERGGCSSAVINSRIPQHIARAHMAMPAAYIAVMLAFNPMPVRHGCTVQVAHNPLFPRASLVTGQARPSKPSTTSMFSGQRQAAKKGASKERQMISRDIPAGAPVAGEIAEWGAASLIASAASLVRALGFGQNSTEDDLSLTSSSLVAAATATAAAKVSLGAATKAAATAATVAVGMPALKAATVGAGLVQIGIDKYRERKQLERVERATAVCEERQAALSHAQALEASAQHLVDEAGARAAKVDRLANYLPPAGPPTARKLGVISA